jgi:hypothetical protein
LQKFLDWHVAGTQSALNGDGCVERQQRDGKVAVGGGRKQIAAHRAHVAHRRSADRAGGCVQEGEIALGQNSRKCDAGAERDA